MASTEENRTIRLAAVGDLLVPCGPTGTEPPRDPRRTFAEIRPALADADVVLGNLECTLPGTGRMIATEPRVIATPEMVRAVAEAGFTVVSLANNHTFDCFREVFDRIRRLLDELGVAYFGAGLDLAEAEAPAIVTVRGVRLAVLGAVEERTGISHEAGEGVFGVARLDEDRLAERIGRLRGEVDHVIVCPHWGEERFDIPAPGQIEQARRWIGAGAAMVVGHHPHVVQGMEFCDGRPIVYSLGNFAACEVPFTNGDAVTWTRTGRTGCLLTAEMTDRGVRNVVQTPTFDDGHVIRIDTSRFGRRRIAKVNRALARGVTLRRYRREHFRVKTVRPALGYLRWSKLRRLRLRQIRRAFSAMRQARRAE